MIMKIGVNDFAIFIFVFVDGSISFHITVPEISS